MKFEILQHVAFEGPAVIEEWLLSRGHDYTTRDLSAGHILPIVKDFDGLIVMGGSMSVHDESKYIWLADEKALVLTAIQAGKKVFGICLGSQIIAECLGCRVKPGPEPEIGWFPVRFAASAMQNRFGLENLPALTAFHWHGEIFEPPRDAELLASSQLTACQAFSFRENVLALLCHLEMNEVAVEKMIRFAADDLERPGTFVQNTDELRAGCRNIAATRAFLFTLLDKFVPDMPK